MDWMVYISSVILTCSVTSSIAVGAKKRARTPTRVLCLGITSNSCWPLYIVIIVFVLQKGKEIWCNILFMHHVELFMKNKTFVKYFIICFLVTETIELLFNIVRKESGFDIVVGLITSILISLAIATGLPKIFGYLDRKKNGN